MTKPLIVSTNKHAVAIAIYIFEAFLGLVYVLGLVPPAHYIVGLSGEWSAHIWAFLLFVGGTYVLTSLFTKCPLTACIIERNANVILTVALGWLFISIAVHGSPTIIGYAFSGGFALASLLRAIQTHREIKRVKAAQSHPVEADVKFLADPEETDVN